MTANEQPGGARPPWSDRFWAAGLVAVVWLLVQAALFVQGGIRSGGDTGRYLEGAEALLRGAWPSGKAASYLGYDAFVTLFMGSGLGRMGIVAAQVALSGLAAFALYRLAARLYEPRAGLLAALCYVAYPPIQRWNFYILTDSLFVSSAVVSAWLVVRARGLWGWVAAGLAVLGASAVRPHGLGLLVAATAYGGWTLWRTRRHVLLGVLGAVVVAAAPGVLAVAGRALAREHLLEHYVRGTVVWGYDALNRPLPAAPPQAAAPGTNPLVGLVAFAAERPGHVARLAALRLGYEYFQVRPYYSPRHNAALLATLLPAYLLALGGLARRVSDPPARAYLLAIVLAQSLAVALTFADWDGRHLAVVLPFAFLFAGAGLSSVLERMHGAGV